MKNFKITQKGIEFDSEVKAFTSGGAFIPARKQFIGMKVRVIVLPAK